MDRGDHVERPSTTRIEPAAGTGRGLSVVVVLVALALVFAVVKPWDWFAAPAGAPGREGAAIPAARPATSPTVAPTPASHDWTGAGAQGACLSGASWLAVVDQVNGPVTSRSWTRLDLVLATGPLDPAIARTHVYAESVPRIGFCAPGSADAWSRDAASAPREAGAPTGAPFLVRAWRLTPREAAAGGSEAPPSGGSATPPSGTVPPGTAPPGAREAVPVVLTVVSGGTAADGGALFGPPGRSAAGNAAGRAADPEDAWAAGGLAPGSARWRADDGQRRQSSWAPGTYVFRVSLSGADAPGSDAVWFAIELRGPWVGPGASAAP